jgi:hypothetical protein
MVSQLHTAICVVDDEELLCAKKFAADGQRADGIVAGASTGVANHVGVARGQASEFCGIEARIHQIKMAKRCAGIQAPWTFSTYVSQSSSRKRGGAVDRCFAALGELDRASCKNADCRPHANNRRTARTLFI